MNRYQAQHALLLFLVVVLIVAATLIGVQIWEAMSESPAKVLVK